jgi:hypothetical protein
MSCAIFLSRSLSLSLVLSCAHALSTHTGYCCFGSKQMRENPAVMSINYTLSSWGQAISSLVSPALETANREVEDIRVATREKIDAVERQRSQTVPEREAGGLAQTPSARASVDSVAVSPSASPSGSGSGSASPTASAAAIAERTGSELAAAAEAAAADAKVAAEAARQVADSSSADAAQNNGSLAAAAEEAANGAKTAADSARLVAEAAVLEGRQQ